jgi:co-chaperonin GroES (HSP10)
VTIKLLRGRVIIKPITHDYGQSIIKIPDTLKDDPRTDERARSGGKSYGRGIVQAIGLPARTRKRGVEVLPEFKVGDEVLFVGQHKSRDVEWEGVMCKAVAQEEVTAVVDPDEECCVCQTDDAYELTDGGTESCDCECHREAS